MAGELFSSLKQFFRDLKDDLGLGTPRSRKPDLRDLFGGVHFSHREWVAAHESGHAIAAWFSSYVNDVTAATIESADGGHVTYTRGGTDSPYRLWDAAVISLAGMAGEIAVMGKVRSSYSCREDLGSAKSYAKRITDDHGLDAVKKLLKPYHQRKIRLDISKMFSTRPRRSTRFILNACYMEARDRIEHHRYAFDRFYQGLKERGTLDKQEITEYFGPRIWKPGRSA